MTTANPEFMPKKRGLDWLLHEGFVNTRSPLFGTFNNFLVLVILYSVVTIILESVDSIRVPYQAFFDISEWVVLIIFTLEYAANIYVARPKRAYIFGAWGIVDLLAILPSLLTFINLSQLKVARVLRILRFLRLLKLTRVISRNMEESKQKRFGTFKLDIQIYFVTLFSVMIISSTLMYYAEHEAQPDKFMDIPNALWWGITTMTTTGYGDYYPVTWMGRLIAGITMLCGLAMFGMLMNVIGKVMLEGLFGTRQALEEEKTESEPASLELIEEADDQPLHGDHASNQIRALGALRHEGLLTEEEFQEKKKEILARM